MVQIVYACIERKVVVYERYKKSGPGAYNRSKAIRQVVYKSLSVNYDNCPMTTEKRINHQDIRNGRKKKCLRLERRAVRMPKF